MDKPGKGKDFYHTCYCLSGLSVAQNNPFYNEQAATIQGDQENLVVSGSSRSFLTPSEQPIRFITYVPKQS